MKPATRALDRLRSTFRCGNSWESMVGGGERRFCAECRRHVVDLEQLTAARIRAHVQAGGGSVCARQTRIGDRLVVAAEAPAPGVPPRRSWPAAATLAAAWLGSGPEAAGGAPVPAPDATPVAANVVPGSRAESGGERDRAAVPGAVLFGRVADGEGAALPGVTVVARAEPDGREHETVSRADGTWSLAELRAGAYQLEVRLEGFRRSRRGWR
jgi:hypothetical protein